MQLRRKWREEFDPRACSRLVKAEFCCMKKISAKRGQRNFADANLRRSAVEFVADHRMAQRREMYANLVGAAGVELDFDECGGADAGKGAPIGVCIARFGQCSGPVSSHAHAAFGVASDGKVDGSVMFREQAMDQGDVCL